jgi:hypothetical protein
MPLGSLRAGLGAAPPQQVPRPSSRKAAQRAVHTPAQQRAADKGHNRAAEGSSRDSLTTDRATMLQNTPEGVSTALNGKRHMQSAPEQAADGRPHAIKVIDTPEHTTRTCNCSEFLKYDHGSLA